MPSRSNNNNNDAFSDDNFSYSSDDDFSDFQESDEESEINDYWTFLIQDINNKNYQLPQLSEIFLPLETLFPRGRQQLEELINQSLDYASDLGPTFFILKFLENSKIPLRLTNVPSEKLAHFLFIILNNFKEKEKSLTAFSSLFDLIKFHCTNDEGEKLLHTVIEKIRNDKDMKVHLSTLYAVIFNSTNTVFARAARKIDAKEIKNIRETLDVDLEEAYSIRRLMKQYPLLSLKSACGMRKNKYGLFSFIDSPRMESKLQKERKRCNSL